MFDYPPLHKKKMPETITPEQLLFACRDAARRPMRHDTQRDLFDALAALCAHYGGNHSFFENNMKTIFAVHQSLVGATR